MMLQSVPYEQQKALSRDEKREIQFANARRLLNLKDDIILELPLPVEGGDSQTKKKF